MSVTRTQSHLRERARLVSATTTRSPRPARIAIMFGWSRRTGGWPGAPQFGSNDEANDSWNIGDGDGDGRADRARRTRPRYESPPRHTEAFSGFDRAYRRAVELQTFAGALVNRRVRRAHRSQRGFDLRFAAASAEVARGAGKAGRSQGQG